MSRSSSGQGQGGNSGAGGWRKNVGISGGSNRSRRGSLDRGADDHSRQMMPHGGGQGFGGRPGRSSLDGAGRGGWGANVRNTSLVMFGEIAHRPDCCSSNHPS